jgi:DNA-binding FadR family transcriptional regulator
MGLDRHEIADQLRADIAAQKYRPGDKLPGYRRLGEVLGAAPNTVGEAMHILAAEGLVLVRNGAPTEVLPPEATKAPPVDRLADVRATLSQIQADLHEMRSQLAVLERRVIDAQAQLRS